MRKAVIGGITALFLTALQCAATGALTVRDYAVHSDVVLESALREVKNIPADTANLVGEAVKFVSDETITTAKGVAAIFKADPIEKVEKAAMIEVANAWTSANDVIFRSYKVSEAVGIELMAGTEVAPGTPVDVSGFFSGLEFPKGTSAVYRPEFNRLAVRQTLENVLFIEDMLAEQHHAKRELMGKQISIETKFIEVSQKTLNELGFNWTFGAKGGNTGSANIFENLTLPGNQALLSAALRQGTGAADTLSVAKVSGSLLWSLAINALEQADDSDVLSAPSVTTRDGKTANIWVGEQRMIPRRFNAKSQNTSVFVEHSDWRSELMGVQMEVTPELRAGGLIDLELKPKVIDLIGYDTYQVTPSNASTLSTPVGPVPQLNASLPYFRLREMTTQVTVADGSTVGMGGLIYDKLETYKDKVPVLGSIPLVGRLFRSEGERSIKRNLMIFVTATQVDVNGRRASDLAMRK